MEAKRKEKNYCDILEIVWELVLIINSKWIDGKTIERVWMWNYVDEKDI